MKFVRQSAAFSYCEQLWKENGYVPLNAIYDLAKTLSLDGTFDDSVLYACKSFNSSDASLAAIANAASRGDFAARVLNQYISDKHLNHAPYEEISGETFMRQRDKLYNCPEKFMAEDLNSSFYPYYRPGKTYGYKPKWVKETIDNANHLFDRFIESKRGDTAILVGNGPSLNKIDFGLFKGQDVYVSNYAIKNRVIAQSAKGVAVTNYLVAEQEPYWFEFNSIWKFHPLWLACTLPPTDTSIMLNALGGELFFSEDVTSKIAWHSTVTYFWLQILYAAGYKKVVMTGFDHFYHQTPASKEGDLIRQSTEDQNHFDPNYFKGKNWQAADVSKMEDAYLLAKTYYEKSGREIVNATVGGNLEVFRRSELSKEIERPRLYGRIARPDRKPKAAIVTAFWEGDIKQAELHWRLINRLGKPSSDHIYLYKHKVDSLGPNTLPRIVSADIESRFPEACLKPHPAGPNLVFVSAVKMLLQTKYTHFFWLEPDCIPTSKDWLAPFLDKLDEYPDEPIIGTGGGTVTPGTPYWRNHFAGCSLYNLERLSEVDWDSYIKKELDVSFDVWLAANLGYIKLGAVNNEDQSGTIIVGKDRRDYTVLRKPRSLIKGMFEHWRPEKIMSPKELEQRLSWNGFSLYHAIKDVDIIRRLYKRLSKSASTIIINYNNEKYLFESIQSALNQKIDNVRYEVIVVDDGSNDSSREIIGLFEGKVKTVLLEHGKINSNFNQQRALKEGLKVADGEIILLLDGDDVFYERKVQNMCSLFDDPDVVLGQHVLDLIDEEGELFPDVFKAFPKEVIRHDLYEKIGRVNFYQATSGLTFRRSYLYSQLSLLCADEHDNTWLDVRLTRFAPYYGKVCNDDTSLGAWRRHAASDSIRTDNIEARIRDHECWYDEVARNNGFPNIPFKWKRIKNPVECETSEKSALVGEFSRGEHAYWDETMAIKALFESGKNGVMIDVGAHEGYALMPFLNEGWTIVAFEPDENNRAKLLQRLQQSENKESVSVDPRCVSNKTQTGLSFYRSEESTGISGLSPFHESHTEVQRVDTITLAEYFGFDQMPEIDFLKIDTEGHDLFVLQGYPWEEGKPAVIECEFEDTKTIPLGYTIQDLAQFLVDKGYSVYVSEWHPIVRYGIRHDWCCLKRFPCVLNDEKAWGNLLAFLIDPGAEVVEEAVKACVSVANPRNQKTNKAAQRKDIRASRVETNALPKARRGTGHMERFKRWVHLRCINFAITVKARSLILFRLGQLFIWSMRTVRRHSVASSTALFLIALLVSLPAHTAVWPYRSYLWAIASMIAIIGGILVLASTAQEALQRLVNILKAQIADNRTALRNEMDLRMSGSDEKVDTLSGSITHLEQNIINTMEQKIADVVNNNQKNASMLRGQITELTSKLAEANKKLSSHSAQMERNAPFQPFSRLLTTEHLETLNSVWSKRLNLSTTKPSLAYMAHRVRTIEQNSVGRLATSIEDAVLRTLATSAAQGKKLDVLEIGTLFGIGLAMLYEFNRGRYDGVHITAIDPLDGYYKESVPDVLLNIPITKSIFWRNMDVAGVPREHVTLIQALSTSEEAIRRAKIKKYDILVIDGDHTYNGVKADFQNYLGMMRRGGVIIIDDYNSEHWPDVTRFVDEEVMQDNRVTLVGAEWRTCVFRVV